jgi:hypothetical protein
MNKRNFYRSLFYYFKTFTPDLVVKENKIITNKLVKKDKIENIKKNKIKFYIIRISPGSGFFSNFGYVLNHLKIAVDKNLIPVIDMENFPTHYNEINKINNSKNSWEYYFQKVSKFKLKNVYKKKNIYHSEKKLLKFFIHDYGSSKILKKIKKKYIKLNPTIFKKFKKLTEFIFKNNRKVLGVYYRAGDMRTAPKHPFPPTIKQIINATKKVIKKDNCNYIFISSENEKFIKKFKKIFNNYKINYLKCFRYNKFHPYFVYPRQNHRYKLGRDILLEMLILSRCDSLIYSESNVIEASKLYSLNKVQKRYKIVNGYNSSNSFFARWLWYIKSSLPKILGGFNKEII